MFFDSNPIFIAMPIAIILFRFCVCFVTPARARRARAETRDDLAHLRDVVRAHLDPFDALSGANAQRAPAVTPP